MIKTLLHFVLKSCYIHVIVTSVMRQKLFKFELMFHFASKIISCCFNVTSGIVRLVNTFSGVTHLSPGCFADNVLVKKVSLT